MAILVPSRLNLPPGVSGNFSGGSSEQVISSFSLLACFIALCYAQFWQFDLYRIKCLL